MSSNKKNKRVGRTRIVSIKSKILLVFVVLILAASFTTNIINLILSQSQIISLTNQVTADQLMEFYTTASNQYQISLFNNDTPGSIRAISESAKSKLYSDHSVAFGLTPEGKFLFFASGPGIDAEWFFFTDKDALLTMGKSLIDDKSSPSITFTSPSGEKYMGVYKYHRDWNCFLVRAESKFDTQKSMYRNFLIVSVLILVVTAIVLVCGMLIYSKLLANISKYTKAILKIHENGSLKTRNTSNAPAIDISDSPNDDITYLAANFNELYSTTQDLLMIFQKFVPENVANEAYANRKILLDGQPKELTILFSDIRSFTYRTEILEDDIIKILNVHYKSVIEKINGNNGIIGSIIGDAILASYGIDETVHENKSFNAIRSAWEITAITADLRNRIEERFEQIKAKRTVTPVEEKILEAVMFDIGVGIDGGNVFYGNIGSGNRLANTVIGDNVNSASRLEGLTRVYKVPVIVSDYIRKETLKDSKARSRYVFYEVDTVMVKGKTESVKIYLPVDRNCVMEEWKYENVKERLDLFEDALSAYYKGEWKTARAGFKKCGLSLADVYLERIGMRNAPAGWSGVWTMSTK